MAEKTDLNKVVDKVLVSEEELQRRIAELALSFRRITRART